MKNLEEKIKLIHSMAMKIILLVACTSIFVASVCGIFYVTFMSNLTKTHIMNNMMDLADSYGSIINLSLQSENINYDDYNALLSNVKLKGVEGSYAYLVDENGIMIYHPTKEKVGKPVENTVVAGLVKELQAGNKPPNDVVSYEYKGATK